MKNTYIYCLFALTLFLSACTGIPKGIEPVSELDTQQYLGKWYEIARLDHSFERGLSKVSAEYSLRPDQGLKVINRGWNDKKQEWKEAEGKAYRVSKDQSGYFKVSFFGPFYGSYIVFELGDNYEYAFVSGNTKKYLWLLARTPTVDESLLNRFKQVTIDKGFDLDKLIILQND